MENNLVIYENMYLTSINELNLFKKKLEAESIELEEILQRNIINNFIESKSNLDIYDYIFAIFFGLSGAILSTNEQISEFSDQIHKHSSGKEKKKSNLIQSFLGDLIHHEGHSIDIPIGSTNFINRDGENAYGLFHRLFFGHDILSIGHGDNPFLLMIEQNGLISGIIQVFRHLIADTFSKQGLPLPGSSYLDFKNENGKTSNYLLSIVQNIASSKGNGSLAQEYYSHMFTIRMQDVAAQGLVFASGQAYFYFRGIKDKIRQTQYKIISYTVNFLAHALIGSLRQGGVPYINWAALTMMIKEIANLYIKSNEKTKRFIEITDSIVIKNSNLISKGDMLENNIFNTGSYLKTNNSAYGYISDYISEENSSLDLIDFFEED